MGISEATCTRSWLGCLTRHIPPGQFSRYMLVGGWNTIFGYSSFAVLTYLFTPIVQHSYLFALAAASVLNITVSFLGYKWFVFETKGNYLTEWWRCLVVYSGSILAGLVLLPLLVYLARRFTGAGSAAPYIAGALLTVLNIIYSFLGHKKFSFRSYQS